MKKVIVCFCLAMALFVTSCGSGRGLSSSSLLHISQDDSTKIADTHITSAKKASGYKGVSRVRTSQFAHPDVPASFDGFRIAFVSDIHYKSKLKEEGLANLMKLLNELQPDVLLVGGDLHEGCQYVQPVVEALATVDAAMGTYSVLGNNDYEVCYNEMVAAMNAHNIQLLEHRLDTLRRNGEEIIIAGVRNPFDLQRNGTSPTLQLSDHDFVILLTHTPDYAEDVSIANTDLVLAGHTHGGQVTLFGLYAPVIPSHYGNKFRTGLKYNSKHTPMIITNGVGTSRRRFRLFAPSEVVVVELRLVGQ